MPNASLSQVTRGSTLDCLNEALEHLMILPVASLDNIPGGSDQFFVYQRMVRLHRNLQAQGWYCFNRKHRYAPTYNTVVDAYTLPGAILAKASRRLPCDPFWPEVRLEFPTAGDPVLRKVDVRLGTGEYDSTVFTEAERNLLIDVTFAKTIDEAPEQYRTFLAALTAEEMSTKFGTPMTPGMSQAYLYQLKLLEDDHLPKGNVFHDEVGILQTWLRP